MSTVSNRSVHVEGVRIFYREAGDPQRPTLLLLHGFPTSSHMFRDLIPLLSDRYHIVAPDLPGFGQSEMPSREKFSYTFDRLAQVIEVLTEVLRLDRYALYLFDHGSPIGFRLAIRHPERITAIISQNGNAYLEGLSDRWIPVRAYWKDPSQANREALRSMVTSETTRWQYLYGVTDATAISPDGYTLDAHYLSRDGADEVQLDLLGSYRSNVEMYPTFQNYLRMHKPRVLGVWGKNDPFFLAIGAQAFKRDVPKARVELLSTGRFALETHAIEISQAICDFLS